MTNEIVLAMDGRGLARDGQRWTRACLLAGAALVGLGALLLFAPEASALENGGHEFWAADMHNWADFKDMGLSVVNADVVTANVQVWDAAGVEATATIPPGGQHDFIVSNGMITDSTINTIGTHRVTSDARVGVFQFNPLHNVYYTNDASLLLPIEKWGTDYRILSQVGVHPMVPAFLTVVAREPTQVTVTVTDATTAGVGPGAVAAIPAGGTATYFLAPFERLNLESAPGDLTGSRIVASAPVAVFGGSTCTTIPAWWGYCDHISEQMIPLEMWGFDYPFCRSDQRNAEPDVVRIVATAPATNVVVTDAGGPTPFFLAAPGDFVDAFLAGDGRVQADKPVIVGDNLVSYTYFADDGDPALIQVPPPHLYVDKYLFVVPPTTAADFVTVTKPAGATVLLDGTMVTGFTPEPGGSGFECARVAVADGLHKIEGDAPFEIYTYGFEPYDSYGYPGGVLPLQEDIRDPCIIDIQPIVFDNSQAQGEEETIAVEQILDCIPPPPPPPCQDLITDPVGSLQRIVESLNICCFASNPDLPPTAPDEFLEKKEICIDPCRNITCDPPCVPIDTCVDPPCDVDQCELPNPCQIVNVCQPPCQVQSSCVPPCHDVTGNLTIQGFSVQSNLVYVEVGDLDPCRPCPSLYVFAGTTGAWVAAYVNLCEIDCAKLVADATGDPRLGRFCTVCTVEYIDLPIVRDCGGIVLPGCENISLCDLQDISLLDDVHLPRLPPCVDCVALVQDVKAVAAALAGDVGTVAVPTVPKL